MCWAWGCPGVLNVASLPAQARPEESNQMGIPLGAGCGSELCSPDLVSIRNYGGCWVVGAQFGGRSIGA